MERFDILLEPECPEPVFRPGEHIRGRVLAVFDRDILSTDGLRLRLRWRTSGRGDVEEGVASEVLVSAGPFAAGEVVDAPFEFPCPGGPFSASHEYVSVGWELEAWVVRGRFRREKCLRAVTVAAGPCEAPFQGEEAHRGPAGTAGFLATTSHRRVYAITGVMGGLGTVGAFIFGLVGSLPLAAGMAGLAFTCAVGALWVLAVQGSRRDTFGSLELRLPGRTVVDSGAVLEVQVAFTAGQDFCLRELAAGWMLEERAEDTSGTDHAVYEQEAVRQFTERLGEPREVRRGERVELPVQLQVPSVPSFRGLSNRLSWSLLVRLQAQGEGEVLYRVPVWVQPPSGRPGDR